MPGFNDPMPQQQSNPWAQFGGGAVVGGAAGVGGYMAYNAVKKATTRANWGLGIAIGVAALTLLNSSNLQTDQNNAQAAAIASNQLTFASVGAGADTAALRAQVTNIANILAKTAYDANIWNWFSTAPQAQPVSIPAASGGTIPAIAAIPTVTSSSNNNLLAVVVVLGIAAVAIWS